MSEQVSYVLLFQFFIFYLSPQLPLTSLCKTDPSHNQQKCSSHIALSSYLCPYVYRQTPVLTFLCWWKSLTMYLINRATVPKICFRTIATKNFWRWKGYRLCFLARRRTLSKSSLINIVTCCLSQSLQTQKKQGSLNMACMVKRNRWGKVSRFPDF